jgi:2-deoxy-D-gluconate 3-dehydrogenase
VSANRPGSPRSARPLERIPVARVGTATDIAAVLLFLASSAASFVSGTSILVDGGWTAQ